MNHIIAFATSHNCVRQRNKIFAFDDFYEYTRPYTDLHRMDDKYGKRSYKMLWHLLTSRSSVKVTKLKLSPLVQLCCH